MDFRSTLSSMVTASDASTTGGGIIMTTGVTAAGMVAAQCPVRGDLVEPLDVPQVLTVGLFDGISALRVAVDCLGWNLAGHISVEKNAEASRVVEANFAQSIFVTDVQSIDEAMVREWSLKFSQVSLILVAGGPPCQGVSGLNAAKKGALRDARSCLFTHVARVRELLKAGFPWAQVRSLMESVGSFNEEDEGHMSNSFGNSPWYIDASGLSLAHRPRLYWVDWELINLDHVQISTLPSGRTKVEFQVELNEQDFLEPGWKRVEAKPLPTFTTSRPMARPGFKPAGLRLCNEQELEAWRQDSHRFPPYQYQRCHSLTNKKGQFRLPNCTEREVVLGFPKGYTRQCMSKTHGSVAHTDCRLTLLGNSWNVTVVAWLLSQLDNCWASMNL
eukprot:Skav204406  [mRNA]  locus=scaffold4169:257893:259056:+ [translate_table: standard]